MILEELSPEARGVQNALKALGTIRNYEETTARELVKAGLAEVRDRKLRLPASAKSTGRANIRMVNLKPV